MQISTSLLCAVAALAFASILSALSGYRIWANSNETSQAWVWVDHSYRVLRQLDRLDATIRAGESANRGYVISGSKEFLDSSEAANDASHNIYYDLQILVRDNPGQTRALKDLHGLIVDKMAFMTAVNDLRDKGFASRAADLIAEGEGMRLMQEITTQIGEISATENSLLIRRQRVAQSRERSLALSTLTTTGVSLLMFTGSAGIGFWLLRRRQRELAVVRGENVALTDSVGRDGLTGLSNQGSLMSELSHAIARARETGQPLSVLMIDIDSFKAFNDTYGHLAGNEVLKQVAQLLSQEARQTDLVARFGGEEFSMILPNVNATAAVRVAERARRAIESAPWRDRQITISVGIAVLDASHLNAGDLLKNADEALYRSKADGRNRVSLH